MRHLLSSCVIAFSTYSRIPMPQVEWNERNMRHTLAFFPLVGAAVGTAFWGTDALCRLLELGPVLRAALLTAVPAAVTGGIHLDGYCDTVDALASRSLKRLCRTVQISDTGITPGSGVGNHRMGLTQDTLGVPVIAVGVPTVVDGATLALDLLERAGHRGTDRGDLPGGEEFFVTPREVDQRVADLGKTLGYGVSLALNPSLSLDDLVMLLE